MHRYTRLYRRLLQDWGAQLGQWNAIEIIFVLPDLPPGTFRDGAHVDVSVLYDIGCYPLSLLADLSIPLGGLTLKRAHRPGTVQERLLISGRCGEIEISIEIGVDGRYENAVTLRSEKVSVRYSPFFSGRAGDRSIISSAERDLTRDEVISDVNGFKEMLATPCSDWIRSRPARMRNMLLIAEGLEQLRRQLTALRPRE